ncbi:MAG: hypothetical protein ABFS16_14360 [Bacteroidota bacterium]
MKTLVVLFIFCFCILLSANSQKVISLHPMFAEQDAVLVPAIEGFWELPTFDLTISFQKAGDNFYSLTYNDGNSMSEFEAVIVKIEDELFLDLSGIMPDIGDEDFKDSFVQCHTIYKISIVKDSLLISRINYSWFYNYAVINRLPLKYEWTRNAMLLTLKTDKLKLFLAEHIHEKKIFHEPDTLKIEKTGFSEEMISGQDNIKTRSATLFPQKCIPEFPLKDGWLGGDGEVSVTINDTTTLFLFSDSYVGNKNQQSRQKSGLRMVSNSIAVTTCLPNGETEVKYYWDKMYSETPGPIFKSFTSRYRFWVQDAFMVKNELYVILGKVGPKFGAAPGEIFNFSSLGLSMAKIINPNDSPDKWNIELIPMKDFYYPFMGLSCHARHDDYIYFFVNRNDKAQLLVRKHIDNIGNIEQPYEYYSVNKTWKEGISVDDMDTVVNGFRCNTVNYHPDIKQWVMICDIWFKDNKIKMRTAPALTGPWLDEKIIYEIPEVTLGSVSYSKSNFCYLARECIQNYDSITHKMVITYDVNNTSFSEILSKPEIYTPKVITVSLMNNSDR